MEQRHTNHVAVNRHPPQCNTKFGPVANRMKQRVSSTRNWRESGQSRIKFHRSKRRSCHAADGVRRLTGGQLETLGGGWRLHPTNLSRSVVAGSRERQAALRFDRMPTWKSASAREAFVLSGPALAIFGRTNSNLLDRPPPDPQRVTEVRIV
jgi:hypothetical protein